MPCAEAPAGRPGNPHGRAKGDRHIALCAPPSCAYARCFALRGAQNPGIPHSASSTFLGRLRKPLLEPTQNVTELVSLRREIP